EDVQAEPLHHGVANPRLPERLVPHRVAGDDLPAVLCERRGHGALPAANAADEAEHRLPLARLRLAAKHLPHPAISAPPPGPPSAARRTSSPLSFPFPPSPPTPSAPPAASRRPARRGPSAASGPLACYAASCDICEASPASSGRRRSLESPCSPPRVPA